MKKFPNRMSLTCSSLVVGLALAAGAQADQSRAEGIAEEEGSKAVHEASSTMSNVWRDGKLETVFLLNRHLNNFAIETEVEGNRVVLSGKVESEVDKDLAEELALGVEGISDVDNRLQVVSSEEAKAEANEDDRSFAEGVDDATLAAEIKIELLAHDELSGLAIDVDARDTTVTLSGKVESDARKKLAEQVVQNVDGVTSVENNLLVATS